MSVELLMERDALVKERDQLKAELESQREMTSSQFNTAEKLRRDRDRWMESWNRDTEQLRAQVAQLRSCLEHIKTLALECQSENPEIVLASVGLSACGALSTPVPAMVPAVEHESLKAEYAKLRAFADLMHPKDRPQYEDDLGVSVSPELIASDLPFLATVLENAKAEMAKLPEWLKGPCERYVPADKARVIAEALSVIDHWLPILNRSMDQVEIVMAITRMEEARKKGLGVAKELGLLEER